METFERAVICLNGVAPSKSTLESVLQPGDCLVAADGGVNWLYEYDVLPYLLIGDLDSAQKNIIKKMPKESVVKIEDQNSTDLEKAIQWAIGKKIKSIVILGMEGKRIDHTLANFFLLWRFQKKVRIELIHDDWTAYLLQNTTMKSTAQIGMTISLIPFSNCSGVTLKGFQYPLQNSKLEVGQVGVSNVATKSNIEITVKSGKIAVMFLSKS
jgi:thiamine pyrophosphokinase